MGRKEFIWNVEGGEEKITTDFTKVCVCLYVCTCVCSTVRIQQKIALEELKVSIILFNSVMMTF